MGQALRRAVGRVRSSSPASPAPTKSVERRPSVGAAEAPKSGINEGKPMMQNGHGNVLEGRDPEYDAMLSKMVGRITARPGGRLAMGEAFIVERYNRPMPKLRNSKAGAGEDSSRSPAPGTLDIVKLKQILLAHEGKADNQESPMNARQIAEKFNLEVEYVEGVLRYVRLPPEDSSGKMNEKT